MQPGGSHQGACQGLCQGYGFHPYAKSRDVSRCWRQMPLIAQHSGRAMPFITSKVRLTPWCRCLHPAYSSAPTLTKSLTPRSCTAKQVKMFNLMETKVIRDLNPSDINKLISVGGMVTRASTIIPDLQCARDSPPADPTGSSAVCCSICYRPLVADGDDLLSDAVCGAAAGRSPGVLCWHSLAAEVIATGLKSSKRLPLSDIIPRQNSMYPQPTPRHGPGAAVVAQGRSVPVRVVQQRDDGALRPRPDRGARSVRRLRRQVHGEAAAQPLRLYE